MMPDIVSANKRSVSFPRLERSNVQQYRSHTKLPLNHYHKIATPNEFQYHPKRAISQLEELSLKGNSLFLRRKELPKVPVRANDALPAHLKQPVAHKQNHYSQTSKIVDDVEICDNLQIRHNKYLQKRIPKKINQVYRRLELPMCPPIKQHSALNALSDEALIVLGQTIHKGNRKCNTRKPIPIKHIEHPKTKPHACRFTFEIQPSPTAIEDTPSRIQRTPLELLMEKLNI